MPPEEVARNVLVSSDAGLLAERLHDYQELGFESLYLHPVGEDDEFIDVFGEHVLPRLGSPASASRAGAAVEGDGVLRHRRGSLEEVGRDPPVHASQRPGVTGPPPTVSAAAGGR